MKKVCKASKAEFSRFIIDVVEKNHPAMLVLDPDDYCVLSEPDKREANDLARAMNESIFAKDKEAGLRQLRERFRGGCVKKILMDMRPTDGWVGWVGHSHIEQGSIPPFKGKSLYKDKLDKTYPDWNKAWKPTDGANLGSPID